MNFIPLTLTYGHVFQTIPFLFLFFFEGNPLAAQ